MVFINRQLSRHLVTLWVTGQPTAMGLLKRIMVRNLHFSHTAGSHVKLTRSNPDRDVSEPTVEVCYFVDHVNASS